MSPIALFNHPVINNPRFLFRQPIGLAIAAALIALTSGFRSLPTIGRERSAVTVKSVHIRLLVTAYGKEFRFFRDVLGFTATFGAEDGSYADFDAKGVTIALFKRNLMSEDLKTTGKAAESDSQDRVALILAVEDVDSVTQQLRSQGVKFVTEPHDRKDWGIRVAHFRDPDGNLIEINQGLSK